MQTALLGNSWLKVNKHIRKGNLCNLLKIFQLKEEKIFYPFKVQNTKMLKIS